MGLAPRLARATQPAPQPIEPPSDDSDTYREPTLIASGKPADIARKLADQLALEQLPTHDAGDLTCLAARAYESASRKHKNPDYRYYANQTHPAVERTLGEWLDWLFALSPGGEEFANRLAGARAELADRYGGPCVAEQETPPVPIDPRVARARNEFAAYAQLMWSGFELRDITKYMIAEFEQAVLRWEAGEKQLVIMCVPPRCGKTDLFSRNGSPWIIGRNPERALLALSLSQAFASDIGESVLDQITSEEFAAVFEGVRLAKRSKSKKDFKIESDEPPDEFAAELGESGQQAAEVGLGDRRKRGRYVSYGVGGRFTGRDADGLLCDDLIDERDADKDGALAKAHRAVRALRNRMNPAGKWFMFVIMTRDCEDDVAGFIMRTFVKDNPRLISVPLIAEEDTTIEIPHTPSGFGGKWFRPKGDILAPYSEEECDARRDELLRTAPHEWESRYMCRPVAATGNMVDPAWLRTYVAEPFDRRKYARIVISGDTGDGKNLTSARTAFGVYGEMLPAWNKCSVCAGVGSIGLSGAPGMQNGLQSVPRANRSAADTHGPPHNVAGSTVLACETCQGTGYGPPIRLLELVAFPWQQPDQVAVLKALAKRWAPNLILIEDKSTGPSVAQHLRRDMDWARVPVHLVEPCGNKPVRMAAASPSLRDGDLGLPADCRAVAASWQGVGHERGADWGADLRAELLHFPHGRYKDRADQLSQYLNWRIMNALPAGVMRLEREGEQARVPLGEQSRRVGAAIAGKAYAAF